MKIYKYNSSFAAYCMLFLSKMSSGKELLLNVCKLFTHLTDCYVYYRDSEEYSPAWDPEPGENGGVPQQSQHDQVGVPQADRNQSFNHNSYKLHFLGTLSSSCRPQSVFHPQSIFQPQLLKITFLADTEFPKQGVIRFSTAINLATTTFVNYIS